MKTGCDGESRSIDEPGTQILVDCEDDSPSNDASAEGGRTLNEFARRVLELLLTGSFDPAMRT